MIRLRALAPPSVGITLSGENSQPPLFCYSVFSDVPMLVKKKKPRPPLALSFKVLHLARASRKSGGMVMRKNKSISLAGLGVAASGSSNPPTNSSPATVPTVSGSGSALVGSFGSGGALLPSLGVSSSTLVPVIPPLSEVSNCSGESRSVLLGSSAAGGLLPLIEASPPKFIPPNSVGDKIIPERNYAALLKSSAQLQEMGSPSEHVSGAPFVLIPDKNIEAAKLEFKDFIYARFYGDYPTMGKIIGVVNAAWARTGPRIFVHNLGQGMYLLRVNNPKTRETLLSRSCWNIGGLPMFVAPWSPDYSPDEPPLTSAVIPVEMRNVPYLLFNKESLSRIATALGKPESLAPETERKENFEVAKLYVRVDLTAPLPQKIVSGFSNGREVQIDVSYPWLPIKCDVCKRFGHKTDRCTFGVSVGSYGQQSNRKFVPETSRKRSKSRPGRSRDKLKEKVATRYVPVVHANDEEVAGERSGIDVLVQDPTVSTRFGVAESLEEGEISQEELTKTAVDATVSEPPEVVHHEGVEEHDLHRVTMSTTEGFVLATSEVDDTVSMVVHHQDVEDLHKDDSKGPSVSAPGSALRTIVEYTSQTLSAPADTELCDNSDADNPFVLVKNRKCGHRVTKHN